jgi:hypothetical protein
MMLLAYKAHRVDEERFCKSEQEHISPGLYSVGLVYHGRDVEDLLNRC